MDLVAPDYATRALLALRNTGAGYEQRTLLALTGESPVNVAAADLDGNGLVDLVLLTDHPRLYVLLNVPGSVQQQIPIAIPLGPPANGYGGTVNLVDFTGDGLLDILVNVTSGTYGQVHLFSNLGNGAFPAQPTVSKLFDNSGYASVIGDFDHDGGAEVVITHQGGDGGVNLFPNLNDGGLLFYPAVDPTTFAYAPSIVASADFDGDGFPDLVISDAASNFGHQVVVLRNGGNDTFTKWNSFAGLFDPQWVVAGDVTGDGLPDVIFADRALPVPGVGKVAVYSGAGDGGFAVNRTLLSGTEPEQLRLFDLNNDGQLDLLATTRLPDPRDVTLFLSTGPNCPLFRPDGG